MDMGLVILWIVIVLAVVLVLTGIVAVFRKLGL